MFSSKTGSCTAYNAFGALSTPFVRTACFEPAYVNAQPDFLPCSSCPDNVNVNQSLNCVPMYGRRGSCYFDKECPAGGSCVNGSCQQYSGFDARNSLWRRENSRIVGYAPRDYKDPRGKTCNQQPYYVVDETGNKKVVCPILNSHSVQPQCNTCLNTLFACERFQDTDQKAYEKCMEYQRMLHYNLVTPNGALIPLGVEMDGEGMKVAELALRKCGPVCSSCKVNDRAACSEVWQQGCGRNGKPVPF